MVSSDLHYNYPRRSSWAGNPVVDWYHRHREGSALQAGDWDAFDDPRRTTYRSYNELQDHKDVVDGLLREIDETGYDSRPADDWVRFLDRWYAPLRFPVTGCRCWPPTSPRWRPASRITNCAAFQAGDEMRRVQRIAYRTAQLAGPPLDDEAVARQRAAWEDAAASSRCGSSSSGRWSPTTGASRSS